MKNLEFISDRIGHEPILLGSGILIAFYGTVLLRPLSRWLMMGVFAALGVHFHSILTNQNSGDITWLALALPLVFGILGALVAKSQTMLHGAQLLFVTAVLFLFGSVFSLALRCEPLWIWLAILLGTWIHPVLAVAIMGSTLICTAVQVEEPMTALLLTASVTVAASVLNLLCRPAMAKGNEAIRAQQEDVT